MSDRTRKAAFAGAAALLVSLALLLGARGSAPAARQSAQAPFGPVIERTPTLPTPSRTVPPAPTRTVHPWQTAHREREREPRVAPAVVPDAGRAAATTARAFLHGYLPLQLRPRRRRSDQRRSAAARECATGGATARTGGSGQSTSAAGHGPRRSYHGRPRCPDRRRHRRRTAALPAAHRAPRRRSLGRDGDPRLSRVSGSP